MISELTTVIIFTNMCCVGANFYSIIKNQKLKRDLAVAIAEHNHATQRYQFAAQQAEQVAQQISAAAKPQPVIPSADDFIELLLQRSGIKPPTKH